MKKAFVLLITLLISMSAACRVPDQTSVSATFSPNGKPLTVEWICSTPETQWKDAGTIQLTPGTAKDADIDIDTHMLKQDITGFGGAFNEKGWAALSVLSPAERDAVLRELFDGKGANFGFGRVPIGASDYALSRYTLDETAGDYEMKDFSIVRDKESLIPYIKAAMACRPDLHVWGSAWTPPTWMKTNGDFDGGRMKDDPAVYRAYALYLARFVEGYRAEGIDLFSVAVQNEPTEETNYPSCLWDPAQYEMFIRDYLEPLFAERSVQASIMLGTLDDGDFWTYPILLRDPDVNQYVSIAGFQWGGVYAVAQMRKEFPDKEIYQTEAECGNLHWKDDFNPDRPPNDWAYGVYTWRLIKQYFDAGVNAYFLWNMVLDTEGKSIDARLPWPQNAAITVDQNTGAITYTPMFYAVKHMSHYIEPGAQYLDIDGGGEVFAFRNPENVVVELMNADEEPRALTINIDGGTMTAELPAMSWNTLIVPD